jgi:hypothetical protein
MRPARFAIAPLALLASLALAAPAAARDLSGVPPEVRSGSTMVSPGGRFLVHYATSGPHAISPAQAQALAVHAEDAWQIQVARWGWPAPIADADGRLDVYAFDLPGAAGSVTPDGLGSQPVSSWMAVDLAYINAVLVSHEFMHMSQNAITGAYQGQVLTEGIGYWAGFAAAGSAHPPAWAVDDPSRPFGCTGWTSCVDGQWAFFQFLAERYGHALLIDAYRRAAAMGGDPEGRAVPALDAALAARGENLGRAYSAYTTAITTSDFRLPALRTFRPEPAARLLLRCRGATARTFAVKGLAARWLELESICFDGDANVVMTASWPESTGGPRPAIGVVGAPIHGLPVRVRAGGATARIPMTAIGLGVRIGLANPSLSSEEQPFRVTVRSTRRRLARVRVLRAPRLLRGRGRVITIRVRSSRGAWLGLGLRRSASTATEEVLLVRAPRGTQTLRAPVPRSLPRGRYQISVRGGDMRGRPFSRLRLPAQ